MRVNETDQLGIVNNANYFTYMEEGRLEYLRQLNINDTENDGFIVAKAVCEYLKPAYFDQVLSIETSLVRIGNKSLTFNSNIYDKATQTLIAKGEVIVVYYQVDIKQTKAIPDRLVQKLGKHIVKGVDTNG